MDTLIRLHRSPIWGPLVRLVGLPKPVELARHAGAYVGEALAGRTAAVLAAKGGTCMAQLEAAVRNAGGARWNAADAQALDVLIVDATACAALADFRELYEVFHPLAGRLARNGRVLLVGPAAGEGPVSQAVARGMDGFLRSLAKEVGRRGIAANLLQVEQGAADRIEGALRFFCGPQTAYVTGQVVRIGAMTAAPSAVPQVAALAGKSALVTGAARGIGLAIAERLAQEGAHVVAADVPAAEADLRALCARIGGSALPLDITSPDAPGALCAALRERGGVDIVVHNAGITRDRTMAKMEASQWQQVLDVNLEAVARIDEALLADSVLRDHGRVVCLSSISGIAGNFGQTNYATSKAALIGYVAGQAPRYAARGITFNAVAPGFIETAMTKKVPFMTREIGRRLNSLLQGGQPRDVAELVTFLASPGAYGISGQTVRVCGQGLMGA
ncbi:3-oxoacyl-ACP reductase [Pseudoduganella sp. OTU4001]|uniref:3-oxoacyl-ACP reductase n=1 Tax=Pseudoduganella sp. OTU4001 TaxID=3043854 RepID=UPI00313E3F90